jgi:hypothetical protein
MTGAEVLFQDDFKRGLSEKWQVVGLKKSDYRVRDGGLEMRVQSGDLTDATPMLKVMVPITSRGIAVASVKVTVLDAFTQDSEFAGLYLLDETGPEFGAKKERVLGELVFSPGRYEFRGKPGDEGDPAKYEVIYTNESKEAGPLRIIVNRGYAYFQVGPDAGGKYLNFFHSAIRKEKKERGFCLVAAGAPKGKSHWVRFEDFRVER